MAKKLKFGNVVLCEHVVAGERNKATLVNVYSGDVLVGEMPATLALGFFCEHFPDATEPVEITLDFKFGNKKFATIRGVVQADRIGEVGAITIPIFSLTVDRDDQIIVSASAEGYAKSEILRKKISFSTDALVE